MICLFGFGAPPVAADVVLNEFVACNTLGALDEDGDFPDWIEIYNSGPDAVNLSGYSLSDDPNDPGQWSFPYQTLPAGAWRLIFASGKNRYGAELHCNFKLNAAGETVQLSYDGELLDEISYDNLPADISFGRHPDAGATWLYFRRPTPAVSNSSTGYTGFAAPPNFTLAPGFYSGPQSVEILANPPGSDLHYSLDASLPDSGGIEYTGPIPLAETTVLRACSVVDSLIPTVATNSYFFGEQITLPVVSIVTDPYNLWDEDYGIYVFGDDYDPNPPYYGANFWEDWERPADIEYFDEEGELEFGQAIGIKIHGNWSRIKPQKSLHLIARSGYGEDVFESEIFADKDIEEFHRLILRNSGNDWSASHFRDGLIQSMSRDWDIEYQAYVPTVVFINGEYWGIQNLRERLDEEFLASNCGADPDEVDIGINRNNAEAGSVIDYGWMLDYIEANGLLTEENYNYIRTKMDTDNYAAYNIFEIYFGNTDWPAWNVKFWRSRQPVGIWRWMLWDLDFGLGRYTDYDYDHNTLAWALAVNSDEPQNSPRSTFLLRSLMENPLFRRDFINRFADMINSPFLPPVLQEQLFIFRGHIYPEIQRHMSRWDCSFNYWLTTMGIIAEYMELRPQYMQGFISDQFGLPDMATLSLEIDPPGSGSIELTALSVTEAWSGEYFIGNPIPLRARPQPGYLFAGWNGGLIGDSELLLDLTEATYLVAHFAPSDSLPPVFNEINYNSFPGFNPGDWVELHNPGDGPVVIGGWQFRDSEDDHTFDLPEGTVLPAGGYLVLCRELGDFLQLFPGVTSCIGDFDFGMSSDGEMIRLFDAEGQLVDWVEYGNSPPWPPEPNGFGPTLELSSPFVDNSLPQYWHCSTGHGTPGDENSMYSVAVPPTRFAAGFAGVYPNPFNPRTVIKFSLTTGTDIRLALYDISGRRIVVLVDGPLGPGEHDIVWDGRDADGRRLPAGVYLAKLRAGEQSDTCKLVLLK